MAILVNKNNAIFGYFLAIFQFLARNGHFSIVGQKRPFLGIFGNFPIVAIFPFLAKNDPKMPPFFSFQKWPFLGLFGPFSHFWPKMAFFTIIGQKGIFYLHFLWPFFGLFGPFSHFWPKIVIFPVLVQNYQKISIFFSS